MLLFVVNFDAEDKNIGINIPQHAFDYLKITPKKEVEATDLIEKEKETISFTPELQTTTQVNKHSCKILKFKI